MNPRILRVIIGVLILIGIIGYFALGRRVEAPILPTPEPQPQPTSTTTTPTVDATLPRVTSTLYATTSPLVVFGEARGNWYFEASFPVVLLDGNGVEIAHAPAQAQGDWMTENFVPFKTTLIFAMPTTTVGTLVLKKDNPSGLPHNDAEVRLPVVFKKSTSTTR